MRRWFSFLFPLTLIAHFAFGTDAGCSQFFKLLLIATPYLSIPCQAFLSAHKLLVGYETAIGLYHAVRGKKLSQQCVLGGTVAAVCYLPRIMPDIWRNLRYSQHRWKWKANGSDTDALN